MRALPLPIASILAALALVGCPRGNSITVGADTYLAPSEAPYGVDGVVLGASIADVRSALGAPQEEMGPPDRRFARFARGTGVTTRDDVVVEVSGAALTRGDAVLVRAGSTEEEVVAALGVGWVEEQYQPTQAGGGMITTGSRFVGKDIRYRDGDVTFYLWLRDGEVRSVTSRRGWPRHQREPRPR
ncbi:MAG: hypothetical protein KIT58_13790 [Planctomycetota bacterium]|nr:hypothetical protein [Planctomycetota bacterium]